MTQTEANASPKDAALKLALEALDFSTSPSPCVEELQDDAIAAIKEALAQPEQEPVAWLDPQGDAYCNVITASWKKKMQAMTTQLEQEHDHD